MNMIIIMDIDSLIIPKVFVRIFFLLLPWKASALMPLRSFCSFIHLFINIIKLATYIASYCLYRLFIFYSLELEHTGMFLI